VPDSGESRFDAAHIDVEGTVVLQYSSTPGARSRARVIFIARLGEIKVILQNTAKAR